MKTDGKFKNIFKTAKLEKKSQPASDDENNAAISPAEIKMSSCEKPDCEKSGRITETNERRLVNKTVFRKNEVKESQIARVSDAQIADVTDARLTDASGAQIAHASGAQIADITDAQIVHASDKEKNDAREKLKRAEAKRLKENKKRERIYLFDYVLTILSTLYAIVSTVMFIVSGWVEDTASYVLIGLLAAYVIAFIVIIAITFKKPVKGRVRPLKYYKSILKIFKSAANVIFLVLSAVSMAAVATGGDFDFAKWTALAATLFVALIKLGFGIFKFASKLAARSLGKHFKVEVVKFANGQSKKKGLYDKYQESRYKYDD